MIISILNQKGGVGKTTLTVNLARYFTKKGCKTLLVDSDMQGSALNWHERSNGTLLEMTCIYKNTFENDIKKFIDMYDYILIDGVPRVSPLTVCALNCSDVTLIPVTPSPYDIWAAEELVRHAKDRSRVTRGEFKSAFVISRKIVNTKIGNDIEEKLNEMGLPVFNAGTCQRVDYATSVEKGITVLDQEYSGTQAYQEIQTIGNELEEFCNGINR